MNVGEWPIYGTEGPLGAQNWYALRVRSRREWRVRDALRALDIPEFLPTWDEEVRWSDRKKITTRPLFPGYLFAQYDAGRGLPPLQAAGLVGVLGADLTPEPVAASEIERLRRAVRLPCVPCAYVAGDAVLVDSGPLAGLEGVVIRTGGGAQLVVRVEILRRAVSVQMAESDLKKAV